MTVEMGLRERKKALTREALSRAAMRLAVEHGVEGVTVEAIAAAAGVSPRTFHNYFPGKEEAIVATLTDGAQSVIDGLRVRPDEEPVWDSLRQVLIEVLLPSESRDETIALMRLVKQNPGLIAQQLGGLGEMQRQIAEIVAARTGTDVARDLYPHLLAGAAGTAMRAAVDLWTEGKADTDLPDLVRDAFDQMRAGLPPPERR
ncbi:TetR family transcriptional regulator [Actinomadura barringtoniae]|uniref:TetR family transcriptional regulator n=1 Tax=Actinomadura barringtoniae TaxID=1427535 RepID=A0A939P8Q9_9ACTN|nr:TetR family transcriptional regulator [Actinomadura barringtoniae]MBO2447467.1 TetR family transcriptional regulator [Actinomadura barringtoniae]